MRACRKMVNMADEGTADTFEYELAGRTMILRKIKHGQQMMLQRIASRTLAQARAAEEKGDLETMAQLLSELEDTAFEVIESQFIDPEDLAFVEREVLRGKVTDTQVKRILANGNPVAAEPDDDEDPAPAKKPRKAPAKKAVKKAAAPRRGTR